MKYSERLNKCTNCGKEEVVDYWHVHNRRAWWNLNGYFGLWGFFCPPCYDLVSHDSYRKPNNPREFNTILVKQNIERANR